MKNLFVALSIFGSVFAITKTSAGEASSEEHLLSRENHKFGIYTGLGSDPGGLLSISIAAYVTRYARLNFGTGFIPGIFDSSVEIYGGGVSFFLLPYNVTPILGAEFNYVHQDSSQGGSGFSLTATHPARNSFASYGKLGVEWQTSVGFNLGGGMEFYWKQFPIGESNKNQPKNRVLPFLQVGWFL